jgi:hypothetical protein
LEEKYQIWRIREDCGDRRITIRKKLKNYLEDTVEKEFINIYDGGELRNNSLIILNKMLRVLEKILAEMDSTKHIYGRYNKIR